MMKSASSVRLKNYLLENFSYLSEDEAWVLTQHGKILKFEPGEILIEYGKFERLFFYLQEGLVRATKFTNDWKEYTIFFSQPGQSFLSPEKFLYKNKRLNSVTYYAVTKAKALTFNHNELLQLASVHPGIFEFYHDRLKQISSVLYERVKLLLIENAEERYLHLAKTRPMFIKYAQKKHIAEFLGITPSSLSRLIRKIEKK